MSIMILYFPLRAIMTGVNSTAINPALTAKGGDPKPRQSQSKGAEQSSPRLQKNTHTDENGPSKWHTNANPSIGERTHNSSDLLHRSSLRFWIWGVTRAQFPSQVNHHCEEEYDGLEVSSVMPILKLRGRQYSCLRRFVSGLVYKTSIVVAKMVAERKVRDIDASGRYRHGLHGWWGYHIHHRRHGRCVTPFLSEGAKAPPLDIESWDGPLYVSILYPHLLEWIETINRTCTTRWCQNPLTCL